MAHSPPKSHAQAVCKKSDKSTSPVPRSHRDARTTANYHYLDAAIPNGLELLQQKREDLQADEVARWLEEVDLAEDVNNGHESDASVNFATE
jgi:hypothetical protein